ncbi:long-chain-fatty-acid--CoA ligase [Novosphingobium lentum]|uniref:long-chain-fatty-acid--CoA ligase n=1 Tax=Novosphingobium lentum TaxID=145287 RepID=UPI00082BBCCE|nr:long-chain-fatty-acid--CoA ligase [Novosphingobium lentum]
MTPHLVDLLRHFASETPDARCLAHEDELLSYANLHQRSSRLANALAAEGVGAGDRVAILDRTATATYELFFACAKIGAIMMPLNWRLSAPEIAGILADGTPSLMLVAPDLVPLLRDAPALPCQIELGADWAAWRDAGGDTDPAVPHAPDDALLLLYTSGTTGVPKGVMLTHESHAYNGRIAAEAWEFTADSVNLVAMPLFHIGGIGYGMMALSQGGHTVLMQQPDAAAVMDLIARHRVTHAFFVPTVIQRLVDHAEQGGAAPAGLERMIYGASPIGESVLRRAMAAFGCRFTHAYGMTETSGTVVSLAPQDHDPDGPHPERLRSCGKPFPWVDVIIVDPATGERAAAGNVGEIRIRSAMNMAGYWHKPAETSATVDPGGWLCTGDAAWQDADGYLYIHDRYKDMIVSGGENIYPAELENVLLAHPQIAEVGVIGTPHAHWGETPRAYVVTRSGGQSPSEADVIAFTRERLARYKCPTSVVFVAALPRNASGKLLKRDLRLIDQSGDGPAQTDG